VREKERRLLSPPNGAGEERVAFRKEKDFRRKWGKTGRKRERPSMEVKKRCSRMHQRRRRTHSIEEGLVA